MRKKRTRPVLRGLRVGIAVFVAALAVWIVWLVGDPTAAVDELVRLADSAKVATALLSAELGTPGEGDGLSTWSKLVLAQSSLLGGVAAPEETVPVPSGEPMAIETPTVIEDPDDGEEEASLPPTTTAPEGIISRTLVAGTSAKYITSGDVSVYNHTDYTIDLDALRAAAPALSNQGDGPKVLIYHSHATEAYTMDGTDIYEPSSDYRTLDTNYNMEIGRAHV